jgi:hypothetical protein
MNARPGSGGAPIPDALRSNSADPGVVTTRGNAGGVMAVQWSLPAS